MNHRQIADKTDKEIAATLRKIAAEKKNSNSRVETFREWLQESGYICLNDGNKVGSSKMSFWNHRCAPAIVLQEWVHGNDISAGFTFYEENQEQRMEAIEILIRGRK